MSVLKCIGCNLVVLNVVHVVLKPIFEKYGTTLTFTVNMHRCSINCAVDVLL